MEGDTDGDFGGIHALAGEFEIAVDERNVVNVEIDAVGIERNAGIADGANQAAPVRIATVDRGLYQWRSRNGSTDVPRGFIVGRAFDHQFDELRRAFSVAHN